MKSIFLSIVLILTFNSNVFSQTIYCDETSARIQSYLNALDEVGFYGTVLIELCGNKIISNGYGFRDKQQSFKNTPETIFDIGSITKQFTAAAILFLEMRGELSIDDKLTKYFNNVPKDKSEITIHDLLRHQSGLQSNIGRDYERISEEEFIEQVMNSQLGFAVGKNFNYSNIGYSLLALIIKKVSGKTYEEFLYDYLWYPSQMESTGYTRPDFDTNLIATGYYRDDRIWGKPTDKEWDIAAPYWHLAGNGGILSTTEDMYKWHKALMSDNILSAEAKEKLYHPKLRDGENDNPYYAYAWDVFKTNRNTRLVQHNGSNGFFYADFLRFIDEDVTIIMMTNKSHPNFDWLSHSFVKIIFDENYVPVIPIEDNEVNRDFTNKIISILLERGLEAAKQEYENRITEFELLEYYVNMNGYGLLAENNLEQSLAMFLLNTFVFPNSSNAFDSLGEVYMEMGNDELAILNYRKSLSLDPGNINAVEMLEKLEK